MTNRRTPLTLTLVGTALTLGALGTVPASAAGGAQSGATRLTADLVALDTAASTAR